jgi:hypothetical protein
MSTLVPDTLQGALILSFIDFFLSFVIISGIGFVLAAFPVLNHAARLFAKTPAKGAHGAHAATPGGRPPVATARPAQPAQPANPPPGDIAAIAAAVFAVMDGKPYRIINIEPSAGRSAWVAEGRFAHHGSHTPR